MIVLQKYLIENGLDNLIQDFHIKAKYHKTFLNLVCLSYDQLKTPKNDITNDCRGIVLNTNDWSIVCHPFTRFNDYNPKKSTFFNFNDFDVFEKIDGSLMSLYFYENQWRVSSKSLADASGKIYVDGLQTTYSEYFWKIWNKFNYDLPTNKNCTYIFEFKFPSDSQFLTKTYFESITLIGIRDLSINKELSLKNQIKENNFNWKYVKPYFTKISFKDLLEESYKLNPIEHEGFVIVDKDFNRLKIKSPLYDKICLLRKFNGDIEHDIKVKQENFDRLCTIIKYSPKSVFYDDFIDYYEDCREDFKIIDDAYHNLLFLLSDEIDSVKNLPKNEIGYFANNKSRFGKVLFTVVQYINNGDNIIDFFYQYDDSNFVNLMKKFIQK